jgi:hypothetical protein
VPGSLDRPVPDEAGQLPSERLDEPRQSDHGESGRWSRDDLRQRLERLPPGHPSSLRDDPGLDDEPDLGDAPEGAYWREVPRFEQAWEDHVRRWPEDKVAAAVDRSRDPEGSWRGDGNQYLDPEQHAQAKTEIARVQRTEEALTKHMTDTERETSSGWLEGLDHRRKGEDRLKEKIAEKIEHEPDRTPEESVSTINDAVRYTFCFESDNYADGYWDVKERLESSDYRMIFSKNHWSGDSEYRGINTRWVTGDGQRFEVQFHTPESLHAKQEVTHSAYERSRNPLTGRSEWRELGAFQREVCSFIVEPERTGSIPDYKEEGS